MSVTKIVLAALGASALMTSGVLAADLMSVPPPEAVMTSDWTGLYVGVQGNYDLDGYVGIAGVIGGNVQVDSFVFGAELAGGPYYGVGANSGSDGYEGYLAGRFGFAADTLLVYGLAGVSDVDGTFGAVLGGGLEFKVTDNVSLRGQVVEYYDSSFAPSFTQATAGVLFHF
jgi:opacity protein-like surface antigen